VAKYFLDVGFYVGKALDYYAPFLDDTWDVYAFEPNPELDVKKNLKRFPFKVKWIKKAAWVEDGEVEFRLTTRDDASHIDSIRTSVDEKVTVPCVDFSKFVADLPKDSTIVCSFDAEGAEFPVLRKMIKDGTAQRLSLLDIEFHHRLLLHEDGATASTLRQELEGLGVLVKLKLEM
jgi:FkbM family methyltransferase